MARNASTSMTPLPEKSTAISSSFGEMVIELGLSLSRGTVGSPNWHNRQLATKRDT